MTPGVEQLPRALRLSSSALRDTTATGEYCFFYMRVVLTLDPHGCSDGRSSSQYVLLPTQDPSQAESSFTDGSDVLFSLYNEKAAEYDQKLAENWREDAQGVMLLVRNAVLFPCANAHQTSIGRSLISHSGNIPFTIVPNLSDELPRPLGFLSWPDLPTTGQFQFEQPRRCPTTTTADTPKTRTGAHSGTLVLVSEPGPESRLCRVRNLGTRMGPQILAPHSASVQST